MSCSVTSTATPPSTSLPHTYTTPHTLDLGSPRPILCFGRCVVRTVALALAGRGECAGKTHRGLVLSSVPSPPASRYVRERGKASATVKGRANLNAAECCAATRAQPLATLSAPLRVRLTGQPLKPSHTAPHRHGTCEAPPTTSTTPMALSPARAAALLHSASRRCVKGA